MQMKIGRWAGLYPRIQSTAKHIRCGFVCGLRKIASPFGRNGARSLVPLNRVYTVLTQARTGPPKRSEAMRAWSTWHSCAACCCCPASAIPLPMVRSLRPKSVRLGVFWSSSPAIQVRFASAH
jgi:hypothetical protein